MAGHNNETCSIQELMLNKYQEPEFMEKYIQKPLKEQISLKLQYPAREHPDDK